MAVHALPTASIYRQDDTASRPFHCTGLQPNLFRHLSLMTGTSTHRRRVLWKIDESASSKDYGGSYDRLLKEASVFPPRKSFGRLCSNSLAIVQEICLVSYLFERHKIALLVDSRQLTMKLGARVDRSSQVMCFTLLLVVYFSSRAERAPTQTRRTKVRQRLVDGVLLACLLRLASSLLRSLTASYSSDTVQSLVYCGMLLHLLGCDYSYANGKEPLVTQKSSVLRRQKRPPFQGGTVSLNAALFSTTLLVSRLQSNMSTFFIVCISIVLFAFYPATRSAISASYPAHSSSKFISKLPYLDGSYCLTSAHTLQHSCTLDHYCFRLSRYCPSDGRRKECNPSRGCSHSRRVCCSLLEARRSGTKEIVARTVGYSVLGVHAASL